MAAAPAPPSTTPIIITPLSSPSPNTPTPPTQNSPTPTQTPTQTPTTPPSSSPPPTTSPSNTAKTTGTTITTTTSASSQTTASTTSTTSSTTSTTPTLPATTTAGSPTLTVTSLTTAPNSTGAAPVTTGNQNNTSKGFFGNTGAVAGVFTVVGLVVLAFIVALIINAVRRRRAKKLDKEIAEAAAVPAPVFLDDEGADPYNMRPAHHYNYANRATAGAGARGGGFDDDGADGRSAGYGQYSDVSSHGTFSQPPMGHAGPGETYGMRELGRGPSPGPGEVYNAYPGAGSVHGHGHPGQFVTDAAAGAAGIGVARARSARDPNGFGYANALQDGASPYPAFATPGYQNQIAHSRSPPPPPAAPGLSTHASNQELLQAAGMMGQSRMSPPPGGDGMYNPYSAHPGQTGFASDVQQQHGAGVPATLVPGRTRSPPGGGAVPASKMSPGSESYVSHYQTQNANPLGKSMGESEEDLRGAYGGYKEDYDDENDGTSSGENGRRVLKVANE